MILSTLVKKISYIKMHFVRHLLRTKLQPVDSIGLIHLTPPGLWIKSGDGTIIFLGVHEASVHFKKKKNGLTPVKTWPHAAQVQGESGSPYHFLQSAIEIMNR